MPREQILPIVLSGESNIEKTLNKRYIQLKNCKNEIEDILAKKLKGGSIVTENDSGKVLNLTFMNWYNVILFQAGVAMKKCNVSYCEYAIWNCKRISDPVVIDSDSFIECLLDVIRCPNSPLLIIKSK